jgi:cell wall-associated NlpC family hydrolase
MHVIDGAKARVFAVCMALVAAIQFWPSAYADVKPKAVKAETAEAKAPKKSKKKRSTEAAVATKQEKEKKKVDPVVLAIKTAKAQLGKPYRWAATGPSSFDCSGLMQYSWKKAGVMLPRTSYAQRGAVKPVPLKKMKPGDLIFSPGHVGMFIGNGKMIHSPRTGRDVAIDPIHSRAVMAGRVKVQKAS